MLVAFKAGKLDQIVTVFFSICIQLNTLFKYYRVVRESDDKAKC